MEPEKLQILLLKLRKGAEGALRMPELVEVLDTLGGFTFENILVLKQGHGELGRGDKPNRYYNTRQDVAKIDWQKAKDHEVRTLPSQGQLKPYESYYMDVSDLEEAHGQWVFSARVWQAVHGVKVTASNGKSFETPKAWDMFLRDYPQNNGLLKWLKSETDYLDRINAKLGMESYEAERANKPPRTRENTGTCPACFGNFKLVPRTKKGKDKSMPGMVLHGYKRPGTGYVHGNCHGQDWPPFELSPEGTVAFIGTLKYIKENNELFLKRLKSDEVTELMDYNGRPVSRDAVKPFEWLNRLNDKIHQVEREISMLESDISTLKHKVDTWKPEPLPVATV